MRRPLTSVLLAAILLPGCGLGSAARLEFVGQMASAVFDNDDPQIVRDGAPAFLLMIDGQARGAPDDPELLMGAASLYAAYGSAFVKDPVRSARMSAKAFRYAEQALPLRLPGVTSVRDCTQDEYEAILNRLDRDDGDFAFAVGQVWMAWIRARPDDLDAIADIPRVEQLMQRLVELGHFAEGGVHLNLAILRGMDAMMGGGDLEQVRSDFERALELSGRNNFMVHVAYARIYADALEDGALRDQLLTEVTAADPNVPGRTLMNVMAQEHAEAMLNGEAPEGFF